PAWTAAATVALAAAALLLIQTRPLVGPAPDPASPDIPPVSLYPITMSGQSVQADFARAINDADAAAKPGTALLVLGSALSWHQPLWAPLWTARPLVYDNWLWFWHPFHFGTPGYVFENGNAYPDPEETLRPEYLAHHGIGAVVVTGTVRGTAARAPGLQRIA